jgi:hypothetical protein
MQHFVLLLVLAVLITPKAPSDAVSKNINGSELRAAYFQMSADNKIRLYKKHSYEVIDTSGFILYYGKKEVPKMPNKGPMIIDQYYFSKSLTDDIFELTIDNLEMVFPENIRFHYALEQEFRSDKALIAYDKFLKRYKIKYLFSTSNNK